MIKAPEVCYSYYAAYIVADTQSFICVLFSKKLLFLLQSGRRSICAAQKAGGGWLICPCSCGAQKNPFLAMIFSARMHMHVIYSGKAIMEPASHYGLCCARDKK